MFHETADKLEIAGSWQVFIIRWVEWNQSAFAISPDVAGLAVFSFMNLHSMEFHQSISHSEFQMKRFSFLKSSEHKLCCLQQQSPQQLMVEVGPPTKNK
jgi:hypothetical protein